MKPIALTKYRGEQGKCIVWWQHAQDTLRDCAVPEQYWLPLVQAALEDKAASEFKRERNRVRDTEEFRDINYLVKHMIAVFDVGMREKIVKRELRLRQKSDENISDFRERFYSQYEQMRLIGYEYSEDQLLDKFLAMIMQGMEINAHNPKDIVEAYTRAQSLELERLRAQARIDRKNYVQPESNSVQHKRNNVCFTWRDTGKCKFGDKCKFSHNKQEQDTDHEGELDSNKGEGEIKCYSCGGEGHKSWQCKRKGEQAANGARAESRSDSDYDSGYDSENSLLECPSSS